MKDKMLEESLNNLYRTFLIWVIRCYPILFCLAILVHQCEVIHSVGTGDIIEYYDGDTLEYVQYATPFSDKYLTVLRKKSSRLSLKSQNMLHNSRLLILERLSRSSSRI